VDDLEDGEEQAEEGHDVHHQQEDGLLRGARHEAVHGVRARRAGADVGGDHLEAVQHVLAEEEGDLEGSAPQQLADVDLHEAVAPDLPAAVMLSLRALKIKKNKKKKKKEIRGKESEASKESET